MYHRNADAERMVLSFSMKQRTTARAAAELVGGETMVDDG